MLHKRHHSIPSCSLILCLCLSTAACYSEEAKSTNVTIEFTDIDARAAIESLFRGTGRNYAIDPDVIGTIPSISIKDVPFDTALRSITRVSGLTFRIDGKVYLISKKMSQAASGNPIPPDSPLDAIVEDTKTEESVIDKIPLSNTSASEILAMMSNSSTTGSSNGYGMSGMGMNGMGMSGMSGTSGMSGFGGLSGMSGLTGSSSHSSGLSGYNSTSSYGRSW